MFCLFLFNKIMASELKEVYVSHQHHFFLPQTSQLQFTIINSEIWTLAFSYSFR